MKKIAFFLILIFTALSASYSQNFSFGVRGGLNMANLSMNLPSYKPSDSKESRTSFNAGIFSQYSLNEKMALQAELFYSREGTNFTDHDTEWPAHIKLSYLSLPIFFKYSIIKDFYVMGGPQLSYLLASHAIYENGDSYNVLSEHKKMAFGLVPVIGYDWRNLTINLRYQFGLSTIAKSNPYGGYARYSDNDVKSNVFSIVIAYKILK